MNSRNRNRRGSTAISTAAGFGLITGLVRPYDHVLIDQLAHACLMQGARAATPNHTLFRHNDVADVRRPTPSLPRGAGEGATTRPEACLA